MPRCFVSLARGKRQPWPKPRQGGGRTAALFELPRSVLTADAAELAFIALEIDVAPS